MIVLSKNFVITGMVLKQKIRLNVIISRRQHESSDPVSPPISIVYRSW